jgi:sugar O-acyltransferase (sialic acid O-acetyltransferase NeuD family)
MSSLVIFGAGDIARLAHHYFTRDSPHEVVAFTVDREHLREPEFLGLPVVDFAEVERRFAPDHHQMFVALSYSKMNRPRAAKCAEARARGYSLATYVSSRCSYLSDEPPGENCFILEDNTVQPFVRIGEDVTLWSGNHIGHDSVIGDHCFISSHVVVSGHVRIEPFCFLGVNATLRNSITVATGTLVGAGAVIMEDTVADGVYLPARGRLAGVKSSEVDL